MKYFTIKELYKSETATRLKIDNIPTPEVFLHLEELGVVLDSLREYYGKPIIVSSGYRCEKLNKAVGGATNSGHLTGYAADLVPANGDFETFKKTVLKWAKEKNIKYDELLIEKNSKGSTWVHFSLKYVTKQQRMKCFSLNVK